MSCNINNTESLSHYPEPAWIDMQVEAAYSEDLEAFCHRNEIPYNKLDTASCKPTYQFRAGCDHDDVVSYLLLHNGGPYSDEEINEINYLALSRMYYSPNYAYEETFQRTEADTILLHQFKC